MRNKSAIYLCAGVFLLLWSCRPSRTIVTTVQVPASTREYIDRYSGIAVSEMRRTGVPASIKLAQGIIESGNGRSMLATEGNNHFGIKCHNGWTGESIRHDDDRRNECFRKYRNAEESFVDHSNFLRNTRRYHSLFELDPVDYKGWARGLKKAGYATNPDYDNMLIRKIEELALYEFDRIVNADAAGNKADRPREADRNPVTDNMAMPGRISYGSNTRQGEDTSPVHARVMENNRIKYIIVDEGDTKAGLEEDLKLLRWELARYNELPDDFTPSPGQILYLQPKRNKAEFGRDHHVVAAGETMYSVSQVYGIKLEKLYLMNRMETGTEPVEGQMLWLRRLKPVL